jgi:hypothetical protein
MGSQRIEVNVANQAQQIFILIADDGFIPALEQVTDFTVLTVEILRLGLL